MKGSYIFFYIRVSLDYICRIHGIFCVKSTLDSKSCEEYVIGIVLAYYKNVHFLNKGRPSSKIFLKSLLQSCFLKYVDML